MAGKRLRKNGTWEYVFKRAGLLDRPIYMTFSTEAEGDAYADRLETLLDRGIIPTEHQSESRVLTVRDLVREYERDTHPSQKDLSALGVIVRMWGDTRLSIIDAGWVDTWISEMKRIEVLAPATIRARVGALARCTDWGMRKKYLQLPDHPFRSLPDGYSQYTDTDAALTGGGRVDIERDRRLEPGEHERILAVIDSGVIKQKQRDFELPHPPALRCLYILALESAMRMREMYTLRRGQVDLARKTVFLDRTKNGDKRQVPMTSVAHAVLSDWLGGGGERDDLVFPWWDGSPRSLADVSDELSKTWKKIFLAAGCRDLKFHDLRHEATSRLFERTTLSETAIMKITGHKSQRMLMRYANLRASQLADALW